MLTTALEGHGNIKCSTSRERTADTRHGDHGNVLDLDIRRWLRNKYKALVETKQEAFVRFNGALDAAVLVVARRSVSIVLNPEPAH